MNDIKRTKSQESSNAIERMYITMRHLFNRGFYKPMGVSGKTLREALLTLRPEIYGSIAEEKSELNGLLYVIERLPEGIAECQFIQLTAEEGLSNSHFKAIVPSKRRRNCFRIDKNQMNIEITRGRSDIYDVLTHLTFLYIEAEKIAKRILLNEEGSLSREWRVLENAILDHKKLTENEKEVIFSYLSVLMGRTFSEIQIFYKKFQTKENPNRFFEIVYWMGNLALKELLEDKKHVINFSPILRERIGHHIYGDIWAKNIKDQLKKNNLLHRELHIISANMHSVMNTLYVSQALPKEFEAMENGAIFENLSKSENSGLQEKIRKYAAKNGLVFVDDTSGTNIDVQIIDTAKVDLSKTNFSSNKSEENKPVIIVMDYAFGEQAYETLDELLKPYQFENGLLKYLNVHSVSIMGKAGILEGGKGDIMIPTAHVFEGTADNYPFKNKLKKEDLSGYGIDVYKGTMVTVLGTSLQNKDLLEFFYNSSWKVIGLEMEGAHYQKAIQAASRIRGNISKKVDVRYAYYASDNPLETGSTLASGGLGTTGVKPTYLITQKILEQIL
ncbi:DUF6909 family protein [Namhaeicola litoreus]|uniref:DUF6909 family protein n=1 Tax=Namhaeicola litoreus TaxID=1052145 RepID=A0ABW3Y1B0_9FLAO